MLPDFAHSLYQAFEREKIPLLLAGGWAVCHHGYSRLTLDVDWVCPRSKEAPAVALMDTLGFAKMTGGMASRFKNRKVAVFPYIDLIWVDDTTFVKMAEPDPGQTSATLPVINFRSLLAMKLHALKDGEARDYRDLNDLRLLLKHGHIKVSDVEFKAMCQRYAGPDAYNQIRLP